MRWAARRLARLSVQPLEDRDVPSATGTDNTVSPVTPPVDDDPAAQILHMQYPQLGDRVWKDTNANGVQDPGEPGVPFVTLQLFQGDKLVGTTTSDIVGKYAFNRWNVTNGTASTADDGMTAGTSYQIRIAANQSALIGLRPTRANVGTDELSDSDAMTNAAGATLDCTLGPAAVYAHYDVGYVTAAAIGNLVWADANNNGKKDANEAGLPGIAVRLLDASGTAEVATTTTGPDGTYLFNGLLPGTYVVEIAKSNFTAGAALYGCASSTGASGQLTGPFEGNGGWGGDGTDHGTTADGVVRCKAVAVLGNSPNNQSVDFGFFRPGTLSGRVYVDMNANGRADYEDSTGLAGIKITAAGPAGVFATTTDATGHYSFANLPAATYTINVAQPTGYRSSTPTFLTAAIGPNAATTIDFGAVRAVDLSVKLTAQPNAVAAGGIITLTYRVKNLGTLDATGVTLLMPLPAGMTIVDVNQYYATFDMVHQRASIATLAAGADAMVVLRVRASRAGMFHLTSTVQGTASEDMVANNRSMVWAMVGAPLPSASKAVKPMAFLTSSFRR